MSDAEKKTAVSIQGVPVDATPPTAGQVLTSDGSKWAPSDLPVPPASMAPEGPIVLKISSSTNMNRLTDVVGVVLVETPTSAALALELPTLTSGSRVITVKDIGGQASTHHVVIGTAGNAFPIEGNLTYTLTVDFSSVTLAFLDGKWWIIGGYKI